MNIERGQVAEFHYASAGNTSGEYVAPKIASASSSIKRTYRITDLKVTCATAATFKLICAGSSNQTLQFSVPANGAVGFNWTMPYRFSVVSTTGALRGLRASTSITGVRYSVSGYIENSA